jgi:hypothetical protein
MGLVLTESEILKIREPSLDRSEEQMIVLGVILLLIGYFTGLSILYTIGGILLVIGVVLWILGAVGRPVGGRKVWF